MRRRVWRIKGVHGLSSYPPRSLRGFPAHVLAQGTPLYRIHRREFDPWWFSSDGSGRFDLPPNSGRGTCYFAVEPAGCFLEVFRDWLLVPEMEVSTRRLAEVVPEHELRLADCTSEQARAFGITAEIHSSADYAPCQAWSQAFAGAGFDGVLYFLRHDPAQGLAGVGWFARAGAGKPAGKHRVSQSLIPSPLIVEVARRFGIRVLPTP